MDIEDVLRDGVRCYLVAFGKQILDLAVVGPLVADVEGGCDGAAVGVGPVRAEDVLVEVLVQVTHGVVEGQHHNLDRLLDAFQFWKYITSLMA